MPTEPEPGARGEFGPGKTQLIENTPGDPDLFVPADERESYEQAWGRFCSVFPDKFYMQERGRNYFDTTKDRGRYLTPDQLAADAGLAPLTRQSGKSRGVGFRWACNRRLRAALTCFADNSRHVSRWAADLYARARGRGCRHAHAIRILGRAWVRVLWRAWVDRKPYDPALHGAVAAMG